MRTGAVLAADKANRYQALGALGQPVFQAHVQLKAAVAQRLGPQHAACFARPDRDPRDETVRWVADIPGPARRWTELDQGEQATLALNMEAMRAEFRGYIAELRAAPPNPGPQGTTPQAFAAMLEQALQIPGPDHLHVVGDQPIFSFWGFHQANAPGIEGLGLRPVPAAPAQAVAAPGATAAAVAPWWQRLWWLLALLLLLLLLLASWLGPWGCADRIEPIGPVPEQPGTPDGKAVEPSPTGVVPVVPGTTGPGIAVPAGPGATAPGPTPPAPSQAEPPQAEPPKPQMPPEAQKPSEPPKPPESPNPTEPPKRPEPPPGQQPPATPPVPPKPMEIPPDAAGRGDVGFLDGQWKSRRGLVDQLDGKPLEQFYRFDGQGKGETVVRRSDGVECKAPAEARFDGGKLTVEEKGSPTCPDGRSYGGSRTECERTATGVTVCRGVNPDGSGYRVGLDKVQP